MALKWGCCELNEHCDEYLQCCKCNKAYHYDCLAMEESTEIMPWICHLCNSLTTETVNQDNDPTSFNSTTSNRSNEEPILQAPQDSMESSVTPTILSSIIENVINRETSNLIEKLQETVSGFQSIKEIIDIIRKNKEAKETIKELEAENHYLMSNIIKELSSRICLLEQNARANNVEIQCVPEKKNENLLDIVTQIGKVIGYEITGDQISRCTRTAKQNRSSNRPRSIIVQFTSLSVRNSFLAAAFSFNQSKPAKEKFNSSYLGFGDNGSPIFITEHLCPANKALQAAARFKAKEKGYKYVWVRNGRIYTRKSEEAKCILIKDMNSLNKII